MLNQKIVTILTLSTFIFTYIFIPATTKAGPYDPDPNVDLSQYQTLYVNQNNNYQQEEGDSSSYLNDYNTYNLNTTTVAEVFPAVIGCTGIVNKVNSSLSTLLSPGNTIEPSKDISKPFTTGTGNYKAGFDDGSPDGSYPTDDELNGIVGSAQNVPVSAPTVEANTGLSAEELKKIKKAEMEAKIREECINGIAYYLAKKQLAKMTQITVNWINSGFNGNPLYIRDRDSYFQSLADNQLTNLIGPLARIQNQYIYPFGRDLARAIVGSRQSTYENRSQSTLSNSLRDGATTEDFANDFSTGGWDGWFSMTQNDQNNPLGFGIMTGQELANRIAKDEENVKAELAEGKGFLSQRRCVEYEDNIQSAPSELGTFTGYAGNRTSSQNKGRCLRWETVTPGSVIADQASTALTSNIRQLELADSLNESLSAVFQALINQMVNKGLSSLSSFAPENAPQTFGGLGSNLIYDSAGNNITNLGQYGNNTVLQVNKGSGWYNANGTFDITTDLGDIRKIANGKYYVYKKGIISIQKDYAEAVKQSLAVLPDILPALGELDYCIPGPNPSWEGPARDRINLIIEYLQSLYYSNGLVYSPAEINPLEKSFHDIQNVLTLGQHGSTTLATATIVSDAISQLFGGNTKQQYEENLRKQFAERQSAKQETFEKERRAAILDQRDSFFGYKEKIDPLYGAESIMRTPSNSPFYLPMAEAGLQATKYIRTYDDNIKTATTEYKDLINQTNGNIYKLNEIKKEVDKIVAAARKRRADELLKSGIPDIDPSCYDITPGNTPNSTGTGSIPGSSTPGSQSPNNPVNQAGGVTGQAPTSGNTQSGNSTSPAEAVPQFSLSYKEDRATCQAIITGINQTIGQTSDITWGLKVDKDPNIYSQKSSRFEKAISTYSQSGKATLTLTIKTMSGKTSSISKSITIPARTITSKGAVCPK